jgi:hypothetical protein
MARELIFVSKFQNNVDRCRCDIVWCIHLIFAIYIVFYLFDDQYNLGFLILFNNSPQFRYTVCHIGSPESSCSHVVFVFDILMFPGTYRYILIILVLKQSDATQRSRFRHGS